MNRDFSKKYLSEENFSKLRKTTRSGVQETLMMERIEKESVRKSFPVKYYIVLTSASLLFLVLSIPFILDFMGMSKENEATTQLYAPPELAIIVGDETIHPILGTYSWTVENNDGTSTDNTQDSEPPPVLLKNQEPLIVSSTNELTFVFEKPPSSYEIREWENKFNEVLATYNDIDLENVSGVKFFDIIATWEQGTASYAFSLEFENESGSRTPTVERVYSESWDGETVIVEEYEESLNYNIINEITDGKDVETMLTLLKKTEWIEGISADNEPPDYRFTWNSYVHGVWVWKMKETDRSTENVVSNRLSIIIEDQYNHTTLSEEDSSILYEIVTGEKLE
ncbi:hypothetical protein ACERII_10530 [Evansella sp. AB-rgal1]|uniref:hypothetical protein n=1 Tax=Evansella sp. AB-rgal1 TaxID=3242696 RepID=UPI00359D03E3